MVLRQGMTLALAGIVLGLLGALAMTRLLEGMLFGIRMDDPTTFLLAPTCVIVVSLLACYLPARRAARVDPAVSLKAD
jgi:putative ABC transport system permease protein